jgi:hypothetical protein
MRCVEHVRRLDDLEGRVENLEGVCQDLKTLPSKVASIAITLRVQTVILGGIAVALLPKIVERLFP